MSNLLPATATATATGLAPAAAVLTLQHRLASGASSHIVLFKVNRAAAADATVIAWKVVRCAVGHDVRVLVPFAHQLGVVDPSGVHAGTREAPAGTLLTIGAEDLFGHNEENTVAANQVGVRNATTSTPLTLVLYKDGRPLCRHGALAPGATALFEVLPFLYVACCSGIAEGAIVDAATVAAATRISLLGLRSADLALHDAAGGGRFTVRNQRFN